MPRLSLSSRLAEALGSEKKADMTTAAMPKPQAAKMKVLLVDEHRVLREGLRDFINAQPDLSVCGVAEYVPQALAEVELAKPDVVVMDIFMHGRMNLDLIREIKAQHPGTSVLVFSMHNEMAYSVAALQAGAQGFVGKTEPPERVLAEIRRLLPPTLIK